MSVAYLSQAFDTEGLTHTEKLVLLCIADRADVSGCCWPSYEDIMRRASIGSRNTLAKTLSRLCEKGVLERRRRFGSSTVYQIISSTKSDTISSTKSDTIVVSKVIREPSTNRQVEPNIDEKLTFEDFWKAYPRKAGKHQAQKLWSKLGEESRQKIMVDFGVRYKDTEVKYIPHGSTYLNQRRWEDDLPTTAENNLKEFM